jgi:hypothetical protein
MANPGEYQTMMYEFFYNGNLPKQRQAADGKQGTTSMVPQKALDELAALNAQAKERRAQREAEKADAAEQDK